MKLENIKWDVPIGQPIEYFDADLSYELTHYRPINKTKGLDFNPDWFREDAIHKTKTGKYSSYVMGSLQYKTFWDERLKRSTEGYKVNGYRVTGDNYFWLNFYRLKSSKEGAVASRGRDVTFPKFLVYQYEYFHYVEMCELLGKDVGLLKARALGFSEMGACLCVRPFITTPNYRVVASAFSDRHLKPLLTKIWAQLDWLSAETENAFRRIRMVKNTDMHKRASKKKSDGTETGHMSEIEGIVADSAEKIRGDRTERLLYEEAGSDKILVKKYTQGEALITVLGGDRIGTRIVWGTGGDSGSSVVGIRSITNNPDSFNILKHRHNYTPGGAYIETAMFIPAHRMVNHLVDKRGWCDPDEAKAWYEHQRELKSDDPNLLLMYKAEYCFTIDEALSNQGDNIFPREELANQLVRIDIYKEIDPPQVGFLTWEIDKSTGLRSGKVSWRASKDGNVLIKEHPLISENNLPYKNLYVAGIDSIDIGTSDSATVRNGRKGGETRVSDFCIVIKKRALGMAEPDYVAMYKDRPKDPREAYENAAKLMVYFNAKGNLESSRTAILTYFRDKKYTNLLMKRPRATMPDVTKGNSNMYGSPPTVKVINHYRELIYDFCLDYSHTMSFREMIEQLLNYSDDDKKKFDIVAAMGFAELADEELSVRRPEEILVERSTFRNIGWYTDARGYKNYGVIPLNDDERYEKTRPSSKDSWLYSQYI